MGSPGCSVRSGSVCCRRRGSPEAEAVLREHKCYHHHPADSLYLLCVVKCGTGYMHWKEEEVYQHRRGLTPKDAAPVDLEPSQREQAASAPALHGSREGRFLLYWITTTSTSTSFTTTYSVSSALCTAPGANLCG